MKTCAKCRVSKPSHEFSKHARDLSGLQSYCKSCVTSYSKAWSLVHPSRKATTNRTGYLRRKYGTVEYHQMLAVQRKKCAICFKTQDSYFDIDHDHTTGRVRALLCGACNKGLGFFKDDLATLEAAVAYLRRYKNSPIDKFIKMQ